MGPVPRGVHAARVVAHPAAGPASGGVNGGHLEDGVVIPRGGFALREAAFALPEHA